MNSYGCSHLDVFKASKGTKSFRLICAYFIACVAEGSRKAKATQCICAVCKSQNRIHVCMSCVKFYCYGEHLLSHGTQSKHYITTDINHGVVYCLKCKDYVYDMDMRKVLVEHNQLAAKELGITLYTEKEPTEEEIEHLSKKMKSEEGKSKTDLTGLRGLVNMGNTCFMNCILQVLVHAPLLRDFFLSGRHNCLLKPEVCLVCQMVLLFKEFYSGNVQPLIPHNVLLLVSFYVDNMSCHRPQDAHEFLIATLDLMHQHFRGTNYISNVYTEHCNCIVHQVFTGSLQSDVTCVACQNVSTKIDPFWDISLDLGNSIPQKSSSGSHVRNAVSSDPTSLQQCLERFTQCEDLGDYATCSHCESCQKRTKRLSLKNLPVLMCFHLKRSGHSSKHNSKNETFVSFPRYLDLTPFTSDYLCNRGSESNANSTGSSSTSTVGADAGSNDCDSLPIPENQYRLFAVVNHFGKDGEGHYISYIRHCTDNWFKFDDHAVRHARVDEVFSSEWYLLFYYKKIVDFND